MRRGDTPWEMWAILAGAIGAVALPLVIGLLIFKIYRVFVPFEAPEQNSLATLGDPDRDGFFKIYLVGWLVCGPLFFVMYSSGVFKW